MGRINPEEFGGSTPKLTPDDLEGDYAILVLSGFEKVNVPDEEQEGGSRTSATITFEETEDKVVWLNRGQIETLCAQLGEDSDDWTGKQVPVEKYTAKFRGKEYPKVRVMPAEEWDRAFKEAGIKRKHPAATKVTPKEAPKPGVVRGAKRGGKR